MPGEISRSMPSPPMCRCNHFKSAHYWKGDRCAAPGCSCRKFKRIPFNQSKLGKDIEAWLTTPASRSAAQSMLDQDDFVTSEPTSATPEALERLRLTVQVHDLKSALEALLGEFDLWCPNITNSAKERAKTLLMGKNAVPAPAEERLMERAFANEALLVAAKAAADDLHHAYFEIIRSRGTHPDHDAASDAAAREPGLVQLLAAIAKAEAMLKEAS